MEDVFLITLIGVIMLMGFLGEMIFKKSNIPNVIWLMLIGLLLGPITGTINREVFLEVSGFVAAVAIIMILFDAGLNMKLETFLKDAPRTVLLTVCSFTLSVLAVTLVMVAVGQSVMNGLLLGAIVGGTSAPIVVPIIMNLTGVRKDTRMILSLESVLTDVLCIVTALTLIGMLKPEAALITSPAQALASSFSVGIVLGLITGIIFAIILKKAAKYDYYYLFSLGLVFLVYSMTELVGGSGALACLTIGIVLGNSRKVLRIFQIKGPSFEMDEGTKYFHSLITFLIRTFFFVYLGILVSLHDYTNIIIGLLITLLIFAVRPFAVKASMYKYSCVTKKDRQIMSFMVPRGLAAAVLAYMPIAAGIPGTMGFADITFTVIFATSLGATFGIAYEKRLEKLKQVEKKNGNSTKTNSKQKNNKKSV